MIKPFPTPYKIHNLRLTNGCDIAYIDEGAGDRTLVFVHGLATYALSWKYNIDHLKQHFRCIAIDLPGNGFSGRGDYPYSIEFFSGCVYDLIYQLGLTNVTLVGHSMGGQVAMNLVINAPLVAEKLVLCAPAGFETFTAFEKTMYLSTIHLLDFFSSEENSLDKTIHMSFFRRHPAADSIANELIELLRTYPLKDYRAMIQACISGMMNEPVYDKLHLIRQETLVIFGDHDGLVPNKLIHHTSTKQIAQTACSNIPKVKLEIIPSCGHFVHIERADLVNRYIHQFVAGRLA